MTKTIHIAGAPHVPQYTNTFVYDGWNLLATLTSNSQLLSSFTWGLDLSGSIQGAGGVGGLLAASYYSSATTNCFAAYDGNGSVAALVNVNDGMLTANYEYGPFGEVIRMTGLMAFANPKRKPSLNRHLTLVDLKRRSGLVFVKLVRGLTSPQV